MSQHPLIRDIESSYQRKDLPDFRAGDSVRVHTLIKEGAYTSHTAKVCARSIDALGTGLWMELTSTATPMTLNETRKTALAHLAIDAWQAQRRGRSLALAALASLCAGEREAVAILRRLLGRVRPNLAAGAR